MCVVPGCVLQNAGWDISCVCTAENGSRVMVLWQGVYAADVYFSNLNAVGDALYCTSGTSQCTLQWSLLEKKQVFALIVVLRVVHPWCSVQLLDACNSRE